MFESNKTIELWCGDCLELMKNIPDGSVDMVLCDPPYGIDYQSMRKKDKTKRLPKILNDKKPFTSFIPEIKRIIKTTGCVAIFTRWDVQHAFIEAMEKNGLRPNNSIVWDKKIHGMGDLKRSFGSRYENILFHAEHDFRFQGKRPTDIIACQRVTSSKLLHPNEKPVQLLEKLMIECCPDNGVVLDTFMGSGSTGVACMNTNRCFIGIELDENYFEIAKKRIEGATLCKCKVRR
jgi:site-specific DNA-methyltransferase (adenine-specific)